MYLSPSSRISVWPGDTSYLRVCDGGDRCKSEVYTQSGANRVTHSAGGVSGKAVSRIDTDRV